MKSLKNESIVSQLYKQPQKEIPATHKMIYKPNYEHEIDILYVPRDGEYLYILSVVDCHNSLCDARPLKSRKGEEIVNNLNDIYNKSKYLKKPQHIHVDNEFNKTYFSKYCEENDIKLHTAAPYRSRQQAHVERLNQEIGRLIFRMELDEEIDTGKTSTRWVQELAEFNGLPNITFHGLRHSLVCYLATEVKLTPYEVADRIGDTVQVVMQHYYQFFQESRIEVANTISRHENEYFNALINKGGQDDSTIN